MKAKEFKEMIQMVPDDFELGYNKVYIIEENFNRGTSITKHFVNDINININIKDKKVSLIDIEF